MSFLAPLFFLGLLTAGLPVVFHLIRRTTRERTPFSSLMFLAPTPPRLTQRSRLEHLLLLFLRCLAIALLGFGFARPFMKRAMAPPPNANAHRVLVLVDTSASMRRAGVWAEARHQVDSILQGASLLDQFALYTFDRQTKSLVGFNEWNAMPAGERAALASRKLAEQAPGWAGTQLGSALIQAAEVLAEPIGKSQASSGRIEVITDLQEGSHLEQLQGYEWPKGIEVAVHTVRGRNANNASLQLVSDEVDSDANKANDTRVRISNSPGSKREQFKVGWRNSDAGFVGQPVDVYVPAGQSRVVGLPIAPGIAADRIALEGDDEDFDNVVFAKPPEPIQLSVLYIGNDDPGNPRQGLYFLKRAFQETRRQTVEVVAAHPGEGITQAQLQGATICFVGSPVSNETAAALHDQVTAGKTVLAIPSGTGMESTLGKLLGTGSLAYQPIRPSNYAMLGELDFRHPLFAPFADPRYSDFTKIHFWAYSRLDPSGIPNARVLARFDSGDPALIEVPTGSGRVLILTSGWQPDSSQLALSSKFVPLLYSLLETSGAPSPLPAQYRIGDVVPLGPLTGSSSVTRTVRLPGGGQQNLDSAQTNFLETAVPGIYTVSAGGPAKTFVVNLDPSESRTSPIAVEELERLGVPMAQTASKVAADENRKVRFQNVELENRQKMWRWFIIGTILVLIIESWFGGRAARRVSPVASPAPG
ncbi:MAG TPA: BatA domain-containing protein [Verrucomicrobiae bacterium]|nr:BatA domain-containing protein [Verrucomicrobiae bacterium]